MNEIPHVCQYNEGVDCINWNRKCDRCGWNPEVANARSKKLADENRKNIQEMHSKTDENRDIIPV